MTNIDLPTAKRLSEGVRCPTCEGSGWNNQRPEPPQVLAVTTLADCPTCDGTGRVFFKGGFDRVYYYDEDGCEDTASLWGTNDYAKYYPAPHPVDVLLWLEEVGVIHYFQHTNKYWTALTDLHTVGSAVTASAPGALLSAVLEKVS